MQSEIRVPDQRLETFALLANLSDEAFKELYAQASKIPATYSEKSILTLSAEAKHTEKGDFTKLLRLILSLFAPLIASRKSINDFVDVLITSFATKSKEEFSSESLGNLKANLEKLLRIPTLAINAKALSVLYENSKNYHASRLLCDIRPVFGLEDDAVFGSVIVNTLKIEFVEDHNNDGELYITLDESDINDLIAKLERQKTKIQELKKIAESNQLKVIELNK